MLILCHIIRNNLMQLFKIDHHKDTLRQIAHKSEVFVISIEVDLEHLRNVHFA